MGVLAGTASLGPRRHPGPGVLMEAPLDIWRETQTVRLNNSCSQDARVGMALVLGGGITMWGWELGLWDGGTQGARVSLPRIHEQAHAFPPPSTAIQRPGGEVWVTRQSRILHEAVGTGPSPP